MGKGQMCVLYCDNFVIIFFLKQRSLRSIIAMQIGPMLSMGYRGPAPAPLLGP